jgi:threonine synthase
MNYISTRGAGIGERHTFSDILLGGLAKDGGLYLPAQYPRVTADELSAWRTLSYADLAYEILRKFSDDISAEDLRALTRRTYTASVYSNVRDHESAVQITPLKTLGEEGGTTVSLLELSNGPTLAFKDMAMQLLGNLFEYTLARQGQTLNILGATSGDTGSAAEYAMRGKQGVRVFMLSATSITARTSSKRCRTITRSRRPIRSARSIRSTGHAWWRRSSTISRATSPQRNQMPSGCRSQCRRAISAMSAPGISRG